MRVIATAGREKLCLNNYTTIDFMRGVCHSCRFNRLVSLGELNDFGAFADMDFGRLREVGEQMSICPYKLQSFLERYYGYDLIIAHFGRVNKLVRAVKPRFIVIDEAHNTVLPVVHRVDARALRLLLVEKLGFEESEAIRLIRSPKSLRAVLKELIDTLIYVSEDNDMRPIVENLLAMLNTQIWFFDEVEESLVGLEMPNINVSVPMLVMSATLPPSLLQSAIVVRRGWSIPVRIDDRFALTMENIERRKSEVAKHVSKYLTSGTVIFTTLSREALLSDEVVWEDELVEKNKTPCDYKDGVVVLKSFGKYNEGINLDCFSRLVILGLPLLPPNVMQRLRARGVDERDFITMKTVQLIGRVIRTAERPSQMPEIILVDKRFRLIESELMSYEIEVVNA
jgi:Rad3-related DNA helicase